MSTLQYSAAHDHVATCLRYDDYPDTLDLALLQGDDVGRIVAVLEAAGSAYLPPLLELREAVRYLEPADTLWCTS